jgi:uncharacterized protein DUF1931
MVVTSVATFERFFREASDLDIDKTDLKRYREFVQAKTADLLTIAQARAKADDRDIIELRDLPITKGLQQTIHELRRLDVAEDVRRSLGELAVRPQLDLGVSDEIEAALPEIAGGLSLALGRTFRILDPNMRNPQTEQWERAFQVFDLLL